MNIKNILLGITGGIAAYKSLEIARLLKESGYVVRIVMTKHACEFIQPLSFQAISGNPVCTDLMDKTHDSAMRHIELAKWADIILIAPASANIIGKLANGIADDLLTTVCMASAAKLILAPAMNRVMWEKAAVQNNLTILRSQGVEMIGPDCGLQACGDNGFGRMSEPEDIVTQIKLLCIEKNHAWQNKKVLITAGPTQEFIDPIRYITNKSSGKMGYAIANAFAAYGADVILISGPTQLTPPNNIKTLFVTTALEMHDAVMKKIAGIDIFVATAAVANYRIENVSKQKIKSTDAHLTLSLVKNPDIIESVSACNRKPFIVGFAAETENIIHYATKKMNRKNMDMIVANDVSDNQGMGADLNTVTIISKDGQRKHFDSAPKSVIAVKLVDSIAHFLSRPIRV